MPIEAGVCNLVADRGAERHRPEAFAERFKSRHVAIRSQLVALITEHVAEVVQLREPRHVADIAGEIILASKSRDRLGVLDVLDDPAHNCDDGKKPPDDENPHDSHKAPPSA